MVAAGESFGPGVSFFGSSGSGKSYAATTLAINMVLEGASGTLIDPKSEMGRLLSLDGFIGSVSCLDVTDGDGCSGMLDPFLIERLRSKREGVKKRTSDFIPRVMTVLSIVMGPSYARYKSTIYASLDEYEKIAQRDPSVWDYVNFLKKTRSGNERDADRNNLASELEILSKNPSADLIFGRHDPRALEFISSLTDNETGMRIITTLGLNLPTDGNMDPNDEQRVAQTILFLLCDIIFSGMSDKSKSSRPKFLMIDESWMLLQDPVVANLVSQSIRLGRSRNYVTILISQNASELENGGVANNVGACFSFKAGNDENKEAAIKILGGKSSGVSEKMLSSLPKGYCYVRDGKQRVGRVRIIQTNERITHLLDTNAVKSVKM